MPSDRTPKQQPDPARQPVYIWQRINPRNNGLIRDKLGLALEELRKDIEKAGAEIRHANRLNLNKTGVAFLVLKMWGQEVDDYTGKCYEIFCHHWDLLGERKTGAFVRVVLNILLPSIDRLGRSADHAANDAHRRRGLIGASLAGSYKKCARAICDRWRKRLDIEARDLDLAEAHEHLKKATLTETRQPTREAVRIASGRPIQYAGPDAFVRRGGSHAPLMPFRSSAPLSPFETLVGELMVRTRGDGAAKYLSSAEILKIAVVLDSKAIQVRSNLERAAARSLAEHNQQFSQAAIKTWQAAFRHPKFGRAVRKRFSRAEEKYKNTHKV